MHLATRVYEGSAVGFAQRAPLMASAGVACVGCHTRDISPKGPCESGRRSCSRCHPANYAKLVTIWQRTTAEKIKTLRGLIVAARKKNRIPDIPANLRELLTTLHRDGSNGVHNIEVIDDILTRSIDKFHELLAEENKQ